MASTNTAQYRLWQNKAVVIGLSGVLLLIIVASFSDWLAPCDPLAQGNLLTERYLAPSWDHPFGTDKFGRDVFSRVLYGGRISLAIAVSVVLLSMTIGLLYGTTSGYLGGLVDTLLMRFLDFLLAFPSIFLIITVVAVFRMSHWYLIPILALTGWMETARIIRAEVLSVQKRDFVLAAVGLGLSRVHILTRHVIPNCLTPVMIAATLKVGEVILVESALSFLGIGVQPPVPSWGNIINDGRDVLLRAWWISTFPGFFIVLSVMSFSLLGDGIRSWLNPKG